MEREQAHLTRREREILVEIALGRRNSQIAASLGIAEKTVKNHVSLLMVKLRVRARSRLAVYACLGEFPSEEALRARWLE